MAFRAASSNNEIDVSGTTITLTKPTGTADGDGMVVGIALDNVAGTVNTLAGWTAHPGNPKTITADGQRMYSFYKVAASEGASYVWTVDLAGSSGICAAMASFSGRAASPFSVTPTSLSSNTASASPRAMDVTGLTPTAGADLCYIGGLDVVGSPSVSFTPPSGYTEAVDTQEAGHNASITLAYKENVAASATGTVSATGTLASGTAGYAAFLYSIDASGGGGGASTAGRSRMMMGFG
jgi:hypothetical protein